MKNRYAKNFLLLGTIVVTWLFYQGGCYTYWWLRAWSDPSQYTKMVNNIKVLPTQEIIKKLHSIDFFSPYPQIAIQILAERKEKEAIPELIKLLKSRNEHIRRDAIWALGLINDERTIKPLMEIVGRGEVYPEYQWALASLSKMKYDGAFSYVVEIANKPYPKNCAAISMLKDYGKHESIPLLLKIKNTIKDGSPNYRSYKNSADDAIRHIESGNASG